MPCESKPRRQGQSLSERKQEVKAAVDRLQAALVAGRIKAIVGPQGAVAFDGWDKEARSGVTDACAYRRLMATGSALAKAAIARAEQLAGRSVDRQAVAAGVHSHDGGRTFHPGHRHHR